MTLHEEKGEIVSDIAVSMAVCCVGAVAPEMTLYSRLQTCRKKPTDMFVVPVPLSM